MSDLSDFGGGLEDIRSELSTPEHRVQLDLSQWFTANGADVYWDEDPTTKSGEKFLSKTEYSTFNKDGIIPDLLVVGDTNTFAIEVKDANDTGNIHSAAHETYEYWHDYTVGEGGYWIDNTPTKIDAFLVASQYSVEGALYARWFDDKVREWPIWKRWNMDKPIRFAPDWEFAASETATRIMWRLAKSTFDDDAPFDSHKMVDDHPGIGAVFSTVLDGSQPSRPETGHEKNPPRDMASVSSPKACYKRPVAEEPGFSCHNWRWL